MRFIKLLVPLFLVFLLFATLSAQSSRATPPTIDQLQQQIADAKGSADNAWMLVASALVLMMTGPGPRKDR